MSRLLRCWVCLGSGYVRTGHDGGGRLIPAMPCTNTHCAAGAEARSKRTVFCGVAAEPPEPGWRNGPWSGIDELRTRPDAARIECQNVTSGRWRPLSDPRWDDCVIDVPWRVAAEPDEETNDG